MSSYRRIENRIREDGRVWCYDCENYLDTSLFYKTVSKGKEFYVACCAPCRRKSYLREYRLGQYPYGHWNIEEDEETKEQLILFFKLLGYDTEKDIHQQFMEKHKEYFTDKK